MAKTSEWGSVPAQRFDPNRAAWERCNVDSDFSPANDLAEANPEKLRELQALWWVEAAKYAGSRASSLTGHRWSSAGRGGEVTGELKAK